MKKDIYESKHIEISLFQELSLSCFQIKLTKYKDSISAFGTRSERVL